MFVLLVQWLPMLACEKSVCQPCVLVHVANIRIMGVSQKRIIYLKPLYKNTRVLDCVVVLACAYVNVHVSAVVHSVLVL